MFQTWCGWYEGGKFIQSIVRVTDDGLKYPTGFAVVGTIAHSGIIAQAKAELAAWDGRTEGRWIKRR